MLQDKGVRLEKLQDERRKKAGGGLARMKDMGTVAGGGLYLVAKVSFCYLDLMQPNSFPFCPSPK